MKIKKRTIEKVAGGSASLLSHFKLICLLVVVTVGLLVVRIYYSNQLAVSGGRVSYYDKRMEQLTKENHELENQIGLKSSLSYIESKASAAGMVKINKVEILPSTVPVALNQ